MCILAEIGEIRYFYQPSSEDSMYVLAFILYIDV